MRCILPLLFACLLAAPAAIAAPLDAPVSKKPVYQLASAAQFPMGDRITSAQLLDLITLNKGKVVLVNFFASWCPPCEDELPGIFSLQEKYGYDTFTVIGVSVDDSNRDLNKMLKKLPFNFSVYLDTGSASRTFGVSAIPHNVLYDTTGHVVYDEVGYMDEEDLDDLIRSAMKK